MVKYVLRQKERRTGGLSWKEAEFESAAKATRKQGYHFRLMDQYRVMRDEILSESKGALRIERSGAD